MIFLISHMVYGLLQTILDIVLIWLLKSIPFSVSKKLQTLQVSSSHVIIEKFQATKMCLVTSVKLITVEV